MLSNNNPIILALHSFKIFSTKIIIRNRTKVYLIIYQFYFHGYKETIDQTPDSIVDYISSKARQTYNPSHWG